MDLGFFFLAGRPLFYLFYFPIIFFVYRRWVVNEESFLENEFGEPYRTFKREVPRWGFRIKAAPARGSELSFQWATFMINRELPRSLSHIFFLAVLCVVFIFRQSLQPDQRARQGDADSRHRRLACFA